MLSLTTNSAISWALKIAMLVITLDFFVVGDVLLGLFGFLVLGISLIPAAVNRNYDTNLPWSIDFFLTLWMALALAGSAGLYQTIFWWDKFLHLGGSMVLAYLAFVLIYALHVAGKLRLTIPFIGFFTFITGVAFGALWEMAEFTVWQVTGRDALTGTGDHTLMLMDTFYDLKLDTIGSFLMALLGMKYVAHERQVKLREWLRPIFKVFDEYVRRKRKKKNKK